MTHTTRRKASTQKVWENFSITVKASSGEIASSPPFFRRKVSSFPIKPKIYVKKEDAASDFKTKIQIAIRDIIKSLKVPEGTEVMVVFDSWWYSAALIKSCRDLGHHVTCQIKSDKKVLLDNGESLQVKNFAKRLDGKEFKEIRLNVRG